MPSRDLDPVTRLTADAVGEPGQRTFYLQAASGADQVTLLVEKEQVRRLAESLQAWLPELAADRPEDPGEAAAAEASQLELTPPLEPDFRVGQLSLSYDAERDRVVIVATEFQAGEDEDDPEDLPDPLTVRLFVTRAQLRVLARHGSQVVAGAARCAPCAATRSTPPVTSARPRT
ncbi:MAG TPA: DUF3090 family protein, partial [Actinomycetes bacterium]|nr:DUF3090 family protein [Actinomycetes bacterium]